MNIVDYISNAIEDRGYVTSYSGRGMNGDNTLGVVIDRATTFGKFVYNLVENAEDLDDVLKLRLRQWLDHLRWDSMGESMVFYSTWFPMSSDELESLHVEETTRKEYS